MWPGKQKAALEFHQATFLPEYPQYSRNDHSLLIADNLSGLKFLEKNIEKFQFIYADPPYNSGKEFTYSDKFKSSDEWLSMIYPRFLAAYAILDQNGFLFVSIDEREVSTLTVLLKEIFGSENYIGSIKWKKKRKPSFLDSHLCITIEYILVFCKSKAHAPKLLGKKTSETTRPVLNASNKISVRFLLRGTEAKCTDGVYAAGFYENRSLGFELLDQAIVSKSCLMNDVRIQGKFRVSQEILNSGVFITKQFGLRRHVQNSELGFQQPTDDATDWPTNEDALTEQLEDFGKRLFDFAKPSQVIANLLKMIPVQEGTTLHCLDFFAGTGTLAKAVQRLSLQDSELRRCVLIQNTEALKKQHGEFKTIADLALFRIEELKKGFPLK